jgi:predicted O-linked N-acetylglucosamine transferase (SPINDLY family)
MTFKPSYAEAYFNLGTIRQLDGNREAALTLYEKALSYKPEYAEAYSNMGIVFKDMDDLDAAITCIKKALSLKPDLVGAHNSLGNVLALRGYHAAAVESYRKALSIVPEYAGAHSNLLLAMQYTATSRQTGAFSEQKQFAKYLEDPYKPNWPIHLNTRQENRRLRVGYVSPDFNRHSVAYFIESVLANHDRRLVEIYCYYNNTLVDSVTQRFMALSDHWIVCCSLSDTQLAERIKNDGIDILVDLAGHTANNRLPVFARKPAPVQISYLGYPASTGLTAMDYRLTDIYADPVCDDTSEYTEKLLRLPTTFLCYCPPDDAPSVSESPARKNGFVTFGSFNALPKITPSVVACWSRILQAQPEARMIIKTGGLGDLKTRRNMQNLFFQHGISDERLYLFAKDENFNQHLLRYNDVDICLDTFPYNGTTTTCEALWMGVPTISIRGARHAARVGASLLTNVGLEQLIVADEDEYCRLAVQLSADISVIESLRAGLRRRVTESPLLDGLGLTRAIESEFKSVWSIWCSDSKL